MELLEPKELLLDDRVYLLGKFPATVGREILIQYPTSAMPKIGDYKTNEELMLRMMKYVVVVTEHANINLSSKALVDNHVQSAVHLLKIEWAMIEHNFDFFANGKVSEFLMGLGNQVQQLITKTLMDLRQQS